MLDELLRRRLVVLSGKGGVGKSTVGAALAVAARNRGKKVLLVEIDAPASAPALLGKRPEGHEETEIGDGLFALNLSPRNTMDAYVRHIVKIELLARRVLQSPVYDRFFAAAPGLPELMLLGKIMTLEEAREGWSRRPRYDLIVLDAPATGHGLSLLKVPLAASRAVPVGPVGANARRILELLRDGEKTGVVIVALPEEMAVVEAIEFHSKLLEIGLQAQGVVLNACHERRFTQEQEALVLRLSAGARGGRLASGVDLGAALDAARRQIRRRKLTSFYKARLRRALPAPLVTLPFLVRGEMGPEAIAVLAEALS